MLALPLRRTVQLCAQARGWKHMSLPVLRSSYSTRPGPQAVGLEYDKFVPSDGNETDGPLVILHGLFGSKRNWHSLAKAFVKILSRPVYTLDLRNHGLSPHAEPMTYTAMASDVRQFCQKYSLKDMTLLGHSMGGKVAMAFALDPNLLPNVLSKLIVVDIAPAIGQLSPEFKSYIQAMKEIEQSKVHSRKEAQELLSHYEKDQSICHFLLTNLHQEPHKHIHFKIPLDILDRSIAELGSFPYQPGERTWTGETLFIKGEKSKYINRHNLAIAKQFFPSMILKTLNTGHWVHAEQPAQFKDLVCKFISSAI